MILKVGITGGIGSGKTLVCKIFETLGASVYYADDAAKRIMAEDKSVKSQLITLLGAEAFSGHELNRQFIASRIFNNDDLLRQMNSIVHPAVNRDFQIWAERVTDEPYVIKEAALLFESGAVSSLDTTVVVYATERIRIQRVVERDGITANQVRERMRNQMGDDERKDLADHVIMNDDNQLLIPQVVWLHEQFNN